MLLGGLLSRPWRTLAGPLAVLLAVTIAVGVGRRALRDAPHSPAKTVPAAEAPRFYTVRAGDTLETVAALTGVPVTRLENLNPKLESTSLFIGDRIRLR